MAGHFMLKEPQKGVRDVIERFLNQKRPLKSKWAFQTYYDPFKGSYLVLTHYHHTLLVINPKTKLIAFQWWEKPTDLRGLQSAVLVLKEYQLIKEEYQWDNTIKRFVLIPNSATHQMALN